MLLETIPVKTSKELNEFIKLPWQIYANDKKWVPPLICEEKILLTRSIHPFHHHADVEYFLAKADTKVKGRIAAIVNHRHNEFHDEKVGFFGFFECINDIEVARQLFRSAEEWLRGKGMISIRGPCNFSTNETCGLLVEGFDSSPLLMMTYNPQYYINLITDNEYEKAMDLFAYFIATDAILKDRIERIANLVRERGSIHIRSVNMKNFNQELEIVNYIYNNAWSKNWGFVPMTDEEFMFNAKSLKSIILPEFACIAETGGEPVGFALALPDLNPILKKVNGRLFPFGWLYFLFANKRRNPILRVIALGVIHKYQNVGVATLFYSKFIEEGLKRGYKGAEMSWILETNDLMNKPIQQIGGKLYKRYRIYEKKL